jgi:hypothetical protein
MSQHERFGELRSLAHGVPSIAAWQRLLALCADCLRDAPDQLREVWLPYLDAALARWPARLRAALPEDTSALLYRGVTSPLLSLARALNFPLARTRATPLQWSQLASSPALRPIEHIRDLYLDGPQIASLLASPHLVNLRSLDLDCCGLGAAGARLIATNNLTAQLTTLRLRECQIGRAGALALLRAPLPHMEFLQLTGCTIGTAGLRALGANMSASSLHTLRLDLMDLVGQDAGESLVGAGPLFERLRVFEMTGDGPLLRFPLLRLVERSSALEHLRLPLSHCCSLREFRAALAHPNLASLRALTTSWRHGQPLANLLDAPCIANLDKLTLTSISLRSDADVRMLAACDALASLSALRLEDCAISPDGLRALLDSPKIGAALRAGHPTRSISERRRGQHDLVHYF